MTETSDAVIGTIPGLLAVGIMANVAGKMIGNKPIKAKPIKVNSIKAKHNSINKSKGNKITW